MKKKSFDPPLQSFIFDFLKHILLYGFDCKSEIKNEVQ